MISPAILKHINPFLYSQENPWKYRIVGLVGFVSTILAGFGLYRFLSLSIWYWILFGPITLLLIYKSGLRNFILIFYKNFSKKKHVAFVKDFWEKNEEPAIAVFLPWCGESLQVFEGTLMAASNMHYKNKRIYILDDKGSQDVFVLGEKYGATYLSRPNKGEYRKSGNIQYGWDHSNGEAFALILDADFVPIPEALHYTIPYIVSSPRIGILQTPQYFEQTHEKHTQNAIEFGGGNIVEEFYNMDQVARDRFDAAICVGTSAVYRRKAIESVGGTPKVWGTEDVRTGLSITRGGYYVKYIPLIISIGTSPDTLQDYFRQHVRWCSGSIKILFDYYIKARIGVMGKLIYILNPAYYFSQALMPILVFHYVALIAFQPNTIALFNSLLFIPKILFELFFLPVIIRNHRTKLGSKLAALNNIFTYFYTIFVDMPSKTKLLWHPAGVAIGGVSREFRMAIRLGIILTSTYIVSLTAVLIWRREYLLNIQLSMILLWCLYVAIWYVIYIYHATKFLKSHDTRYVHPTSKVRTHTRRVWAHVKHGLLPTLTTALFVTVGVNMYNLKGIPDIAIEQSTQALALASIETDTGPHYSIPLEYGDGPIRVARKAALTHTRKYGIDIDDRSLYRIEHYMSAEFTDIPKVFEKDKLFTISEAKVKEYVEKYRFTSTTESAYTL